MTHDERLDRIEHLTAALAEERRKDREEYKTLWRDTQRQINANTLAIADLTDRLTHAAEHLEQLTARLDQHAADSRAADERLGERIASLVSAIGQHISQGH